MSRPANQMGQFPQQPGQQQQGLHPTVQYGQQGGPQAIILPHNAQMPGQQPQQQQQPQQTFAPQGPQQAAQQHFGGPPPIGYGAGYPADQIPPAPQQQQQQFIQQPGQQPQNFQQQGQQPQQMIPQQGFQPQNVQQQPQQQGVRQQSVDPNVILDGPNVPPELRGRTLAQAMQVYNGLATSWVAAQARGAAPQGPQQQAPQQQPQQQFQQGQQQPQRAQFWEDARPVIREEIQQVMAPVAQFTARQAIDGALNSARQTIHDFGVLEADVLGTLQGATPEALSNPEVWISAADLVRGRMQREGRYQQLVGQGFQQPQQQFGQQQPQQQYGQQQRFVPAGQQILPQGAFFSEGPTPPNGQQNNLGLNPTELWAANLMQMSPEDYAAWKGGVVRR